MKSMPGLDSFTFIPMMTDVRGKADTDTGTKKDLGKAVKGGKAGSQNTYLLQHIAHLQEVSDDREYLQTLQDYFRNEHISMEALHPQTFTHREREQYFQGVLEKFPKKTLVILDPDTGLEASKPDQHHLLLSEVKMIHDNLDTGSVLQIYQHFPRKVHEDYIRQRCSQLSELTGTSPLTITDNEIIFFLSTKNPGLHQELDLVLEKYANSYPALSSRSWC